MNSFFNYSSSFFNFSGSSWNFSSRSSAGSGTISNSLSWISVTFSSSPNKFIPWNYYCYVHSWSWQVSCSWWHWRWLKWRLKWLLSKFKCCWCWLLALITLEKKSFRSGWWWWWWWLKWQLWWLRWWKKWLLLLLLPLLLSFLSTFKSWSHFQILDPRCFVQYFTKNTFFCDIWFSDQRPNYRILCIGSRNIFKK